MKNFIFEKCENAPVQAIGGRAGSGGGGGWGSVGRRRSIQVRRISGRDELMMGPH